MCSDKLNGPKKAEFLLSAALGMQVVTWNEGYIMLSILYIKKQLVVLKHHGTLGIILMNFFWDAVSF